jgi:hypothetical protein
MLFYKINLYPTFNNFLKHTSSSKSLFNSLIQSFHFQNNIGSEALEKILEFLKFLHSYAEEINNKCKLKMDLHFDSLPPAIILIANVIPSICSDIYVRIFVNDVHHDVIKLKKSFF